MDALFYEIIMLRETFDALEKIYNTRDELLRNDYGKLLINVYQVSFLLHSRNLIDFLKNNGKKTDIRCSDFSVKKKRINLPLNNSRDHIQKYLSHLTWKRVENPKPHWEYPKITEVIVNALQLFLENCSDEYFPTNKNRTREDFSQFLS